MRTRVQWSAETVEANKCPALFGCLKQAQPCTASVTNIIKPASWVAASQLTLLLREFNDKEVKASLTSKSFTSH
jgi:hypothetical protein